MMRCHQTKRVRVERRPVLVFLFAAVASSLSAFPHDWSLSLSQGADYASEGETISARTSLSGSVSDIPVGSFLAEISASATLSTSISPDLGADPSFTVGTATLTKEGWTIGRQNVSDSGALIVQHPLDGAAFRRAGETRVFRFGAYTPLLQGAGDSSILLSNLDLQRSSRKEFALAAPRLISMVGYSGTADTSLGTELWLQFDGRHVFAPSYESVIRPGDAVDTTPDGSGGTVDTAYQLGWLSARLGARSRAAIYLAFCEGLGIMAPLVGEDSDQYWQDLLLSGAGRVSLKHSRSRWAFELTADAATGDIDALSFTEGNTLGLATIYQPISVLSRGNIVGLELGNSATGGLIVSSAPFRADNVFILRYLRFVWETRSFFRITAGPVSFGDISEESLSPYIGTESSLMLQWQFLPDTSLMITSALFVPATAPNGAVSVDYAEGASVTYQGGISFSLNL